MCLQVLLLGSLLSLAIYDPNLRSTHDGVEDTMYIQWHMHCILNIPRHCEAGLTRTFVTQ